MKQETEKYKIRLEVRDSNGQLIVDEDGRKITSISFDVEMLPQNMEMNLIRMGKEYKALMPDRRIQLDACVFNPISRTYMDMFSYYVGNKGEKSRFVALT